MNESVMARPRPAPLPAAARIAAAVIATGGLAPLAACSGGGSPSSTGSGGSPNGAGSPSAAGSTGSPSAVAYSACMRSHGVPNYPDPDSHGQLPKAGAQQYGVSSSQLQAAQQACQPLLPATDGSFNQEVLQCYHYGRCPPALVQQMLTVGRKFAQCMRSRGVPSFPDPTLDSDGLPFFNISGQGITRAEWHISRMTAKRDECARVAGGVLATG